MKIDIYNIEKKLSTAERSIQDSDIPDQDKKLILSYADYLMFEKGLSVHRIVKYIYTLKKIKQLIGVSFQNSKKEDLVFFMKRLRVSDYSEWTKRDYRIVLKNFYTWLDKKSLIDWIKTGRGRTEILPHDLINDEDILNMIISTKSKMYRAFISLLYETGARIGEIGALQLEHIKFDDLGGSLFVDGKTGPRIIRIVWSSAYLEDWINDCPGESKKKSSIWNNQKYTDLRKIIKLSAINAGIEKRIYPHLLRHSRATEISGVLSESRLSNYLGWVQGSDMPRTYIHLSGSAANNNILSLYGLDLPAVQQSLLWPRICQVCGKIHGPTYEHCIRCNEVLQDVPRQSTQGDNSDIAIPTHQ